MLLHEKAQQLAKDFLRKEAELLEVLLEMRKQRCFFSPGYRSIFEYATRCLSLSEAQTYYYQKVVEKSLEVPALKEAVIRGELSLSKARRIAPVLTRKNSEDWISKAKSLKQNELERAVAEENPAAKVRERMKPVGPKLVQMVVAVTPEVEALLKRVQDLESQRMKKDATWNDTLGRMAQEYLDRHDPVRRAERLSLRKATAATQPKPGRHPIPAPVKHQVHRRDGHRCTAKLPDGTRCPERRWLELDHIITVSSGGLNLPDQLRTLCAFHHRLRHAPSGVRFENTP